MYRQEEVTVTTEVVPQCIALHCNVASCLGFALRRALIERESAFFRDSSLLINLKLNIKAHQLSMAQLSQVIRAQSSVLSEPVIMCIQEGLS